MNWEKRLTSADNILSEKTGAAIDGDEVCITIMKEHGDNVL